MVAEALERTLWRPWEAVGVVGASSGVVGGPEAETAPALLTLNVAGGARKAEAAALRRLPVTCQGRDMSHHHVRGGEVASGPRLT